MPTDPEDLFAEAMAALLQSDLKALGHLLRRDSRLAQRESLEQVLVEDRFIHWFYPGDTLLHVAAAAHSAAACEALIAGGARPGASASRRRGTPLHYAADGSPQRPTWESTAQVGTIEMLLRHGANVDAVDAMGATPLHRAVRTRCPGAVAALISAGANPTIRNHSGSTPFHLAVQPTGRGGSGTERCQEAQRRIVEIFLEAGVSPTIRGTRERTVLESARSPWIRDRLQRAA